MTTLDLAAPGVRLDVVAALTARGLDVKSDEGTRAMYSTDASLYRIPPTAVVRPRSRDEVAEVLDVCRSLEVPVTSRGAGTSVAGNAIGRGVVLDFSRHMNRVLSVDGEAGLAVVEPGTVHAVLQKQAMAQGRRFGPDPSTHPRCTIGGMIGNNACGSRTLGYGRTNDNVAALEVMTAAGELFRTGYGSDGRPFVDGAETILTDLREVMGRHLEVARTEFDRFGRQVSGYAVHHLLPERFDLTQALVGSEGTLGIVTEATVKLVTDPAHRVVVAIGFEDIVKAGEASPAVVRHQPTACEGLDSRLIDVLVSRRGASAVPDLPKGSAWLFVELAGEDADEVMERARRLAAEGLGLESLVVPDPAVQARLWRIREDGAGLAGRAPSGKPAWPGWEDAAVPPDRLGEYLAQFDALVAEHGLTSAPFGHFGDGCMHVRLDFPFDRPDGLAVFRTFLQSAAELVASFGGTLSGEHGDGRARSDLLPTMYSPEAMALFGQVKAVFDPTDLLNPGVLVAPDAADEEVRVAGTFPNRRPLAFSYEEDHGSLAGAVHRCTGVGKCRADNSASGGVMCPSYLATREEKDSTRGRARVLQELVRGDRLDWRSPEVHDSLDLCLACKGCASDCPTGIDMATYKSEVLHQSYRKRLRPRSHYTLGWLPRWSRLASRFPRLANLGMRLPLVGRLALWGAGVDQRRNIPAFATTPFRRWWKKRSDAMTTGQPVMLFVDSFSNSFSPSVAEAMVKVLQHAGYQPQLPSAGTCCGLTWITTGQLDAAKRILGGTVAELANAARAGIPIVGVEPSCTAVLRSDAIELLGNDPERGDDARLVAASTRTLAELLGETDGWEAPDLAGTTVVAQPHCHQHAVLGWAADEKLLGRTGAQVTTLGGCCGLAGNFGVEIGHYEVSVAVAEQNLLPALDAAPDAIVLADGFSCRTQVTDLRDRPSLHLAELLASKLD